jgi:hypothetical protein
MPHFFIILVKINLVLILFAAAYYLVLRRLTFYTINRIFLVFGILFSTVYPLINLTDFFHRQQQLNQEVVSFVPKLNQQVNALVPSDFISTNWQFISLIFYVGVILMALRLLVQFISLYKMHQKSQPGAVADYKVRILNEPVSPFSFWQTVYINPTLHQEKELHTILAHELIHVKQWHSLDIILAELSVVFYWFNPGVWLMKKAVKENLEFITDQKILNKGVDRKAYQYSLLDVGNLTPAVAIVNNFNLSDLKKRIKMMNVKRSSRLTLSRYLLITPVLLMTTLAFTISKKDIKKHLAPIQQVLVKHKLIAPPVVEVKIDAPKKINKKRSEVAVQQVAPKDSVNKVAVFFRQFFLDADSMGAPVKRVQVLSGKLIGANAVEGKVQSTNLFVFADTNVRTRISEPNQRQLKYNVEYKTGVPLPDHVNEVIIKGYGKIRKPADSISMAAATYFVNGKQMSAAEFQKAVKVEDIKNINIQKFPAQAAGIHIITREKP